MRRAILLSMAVLLLAGVALGANDSTVAAGVYSDQGGDRLNVQTHGTLDILGMLRVRGATLIGGEGYTYYVDPTSGDDTNDGLSPENAFATMQAAINTCTDDRGDVIVRLQGTETVSTAITVDCPGVTIVAATWGADDQQPELFETSAQEAYDDGPVISVEAPCAIYGLLFRGRSSADASMLIHYSAATGYDDADPAGIFVHIAGCRFPDWGTASTGIEVRGGSYVRITACTFDGTWDNTLACGIMFKGSALNNPTHNVVERCWFVDVTNGIEHHAGGTPQNFLYMGNRFIDYTDAIDFNDHAADGLVADNWYETATDTGTYDISVSDAQTHGVTFAGNHYSE
ncbi:MAG TPA: right-handed parallel beta-helix repeat-containing protein [Vicinamibacterales bacterium]|nr:right-handed parallel beta-helix repeat-containing protein [Vicinamibacterales bacterium]